MYVQTVKEDPNRQGLLFTGTERTVFVSFDDGDHWQSLQLNLPPASVRDLVIHNGDLIVATHGRGFWVIDNIAPLRQSTADVAKAIAYLFQPPDAFLMTPGNDNGTPMPRDEPLAENPPYGAMIDYYLKANTSGPLTIEIIDPAGEVIRKYSSEDKADSSKSRHSQHSVVLGANTRDAFDRSRHTSLDLGPTSHTPPRPAGGGGGGLVDVAARRWSCRERIPFD